MFHPGNYSNELWSGHNHYNGLPEYPRHRQSEVELAVTEAWAWLEAQGPIIPATGMYGQNGWRVMSRRARKLEDEAVFANYAAARHLPRDALHGRIAGPAWMSFMRGEFDTAVFQAMKTVEVAGWTGR